MHISKKSVKVSTTLKMYKLKIIVVGPLKSGKTVLSNFLADATDSSSGIYQPTQGVRILEFESGTMTIGQRSTKADIELWDCSGDFKFENCWPAVVKDAQGVVFVYNPEQPNHDYELEKYFAYFVQKQNLKNNQCLIFAYSKTGAARRPSLKPPPLMSQVPIVATNLEDDGETLRTGFSIYLQQLIKIIGDKQKQEEENIVSF